MSKPCQDALACQDASNASGILKSWAEHIDAIWAEVRAEGGGTSEFANHPANVLFADKMAQLTGARNLDNVLAAFKKCEKKVKPPA